ncbi:hypothetical protein [Nocardia callitridis]|uniref:YbaB/EbfC DNA-binding family protein n=1 Tax=Nocardia callitridis TaxID=648753 RepID=A0ABP9JSG7_9NOCA
MREMHPDVQVALGMARALRYRVAELEEETEQIVARRPSPSGLVIPEVDAMGQLRDLYLAPGTCARFDNQELIADVMAAITASTADARQQYHNTMHDTADPPRPFAEIVGEWRTAPEGQRPIPNFGKAEE